SVLYDAVYVPGGTNSITTLAGNADAVHFLNEAYRHCKAIAADSAAEDLLLASYLGGQLEKGEKNKIALTEGLIFSNNLKEMSQQFIKAIGQHRFWDREKARKVPA